MIRAATLLVFSAMLFSCQSRNSVPETVIQMKPMQRIVWDVMLADELAFQRKLKDTSIQLKTESFRLYDTVFALHKVTRDQFFKSYRFYQNHPTLYRSLMAGAKKLGESEKKVMRPPSAP